MPETEHPLSKGFTLVEISIVMIIIGLLIGGIFGGMKLVDNANVQKAVQDLQAIKSAALTFKDTYKRLPGDIITPSTQIPDCTNAPCATGGDGNRVVGIFGMYGQTITATSENFTFWHHLQASGILTTGIFNTTSMEYGEGQPESPVGGGYLVMNWGNISLDPAGCTTLFKSHGIIVSSANDGNYTTGAPSNPISCGIISAIDKKGDDGMPLSGSIQSSSSCISSYVCGANYITTGLGKIYSKSF